GMDDPSLPAAERRLDAAVDHHLLPRGEPAAEPRQLVEPDEEQNAAVVLDHDLEDAPAAASRAALTHVHHLAGSRHLVAGPERRQGLEVPPVLVTERE